MEELYRYADFIFRLSGGGAMKDKKHIAEKQLIEDFTRWDHLQDGWVNGLHEYKRYKKEGGLHAGSI